MLDHYAQEGSESSQGGEALLCEPLSDKASDTLTQQQSLTKPRANHILVLAKWSLSHD